MTTTPPNDGSSATGLVKASVRALPALLLARGIPAANDPAGAIGNFAALLDEALEPDTRAEEEDPSALGAVALASPADASAGVLPLAMVPAAGDANMPETARRNASAPGAAVPRGDAVPPPSVRPRTSSDAGVGVLSADAAATAARMPARFMPEAANDQPGAAGTPAPTLQAAAPEQLRGVPALSAPSAGPAIGRPDASAFHVGPRIGVPGFDEALAARVSLAIRAGSESATIQVSPPSLGPIGMKVELHGDEARVFFAAEQPLTREAITEALPRLRDLLAAQGLELSESSVGTELPRRDSPAYSSSAAAAQADQADPHHAKEPPVQNAVTAHTGLVDTFA